MWTHLWSVTHEDDSNYVAGMSNNGGCYSESMHEQYFINDKLEVRKLVTFSTSAGFSYDELYGQYQNSNMAELTIHNIENGWDGIFTQTVDGEDEMVLLESITDETSIIEALQAKDSYLPPKNEDIVDVAESIILRGNLSEEQINERLLKIKQFYCKKDGCLMRNHKQVGIICGVESFKIKN